MDPQDDILPVVRAADLDEPDADHQWLVDLLWARSGVGIIGGAPKCCKSWLALDIALSVAGASPCLGRFSVARSGGVLLYMAEDSSSVIKTRIAGLCRHRGLELAALPIDVITAPTLRLDLERDQRRLAQTIRKLGPRLLLLDPFVRLHRIDENNAGDVSAILAYLRALQREHDLAVVVVHHARKNAGPATAPGQGLRGSGDFHAWGDSNLYLRRHRGELLLTIEHRAAPAVEPVALTLVADDPEQPHLEVLDSPREDGNNHFDVDAAVLRTLERAPLSRDALRAALRVRNERLGHALRRLGAAQRIVLHAGRWTLPAGAPSPNAL
jgi:RecA-family ATPase